MIRSGALSLLAAIALVVNHAGATPPPPPGGYAYNNTSPGSVPLAGDLLTNSSQTITTSDGSTVSENVGTLETKVYRNSAGTLDFVYHITPATAGLMLHSLDVPWINNEVQLQEAGFISAPNELTPAVIARYNDFDPVTFLFNYSFTPGDSNLDNGTADLILKTNAHAYTWSNDFTVRTLDATTFNFSNSLGGFVPEHAPEPATLSIAGIAALLLLRRR
ncbi:MAG: hypothetical protein ACTHN5_04600 [Phycisphaerae bacterium]